MPGRRLPLLPRRRSSARSTRRRWTRCSTPTRRRCRACARGSTRRSRAPTASPRPRAARAVKAKALDLLRGLLPAASLSHMGIYAHRPGLRAADPAPARPPAARGARATASMILDAIKAVMPSFVARVERPDRGGEWVALPASAARGRRERWAARLGLDRARPAPTTGPSVRLLHVDGDEDRLLAALLFEAAGASARSDARGGRARSADEERARAARRPRRRARATAATAPAAASRRCATASRSSPTTARSATSSATGCSPSSGRR